MQKLAFEGFFSRAANTGEETGASAIDVCKLVPRVLSYSSTLSRSKGRVGEEPGNEVVLWAVYYCILLKRFKRMTNI